MLVNEMLSGEGRWDTGTLQVYSKSDSCLESTQSTTYLEGTEVLRWIGERGSDAAGYTTAGECSGCDKPSARGLSGASVWAGVPAGDRTSAASLGLVPRRAVEADGSGDIRGGCGEEVDEGEERRLVCELRR